MKTFIRTHLPWLTILVLSVSTSFFRLQMIRLCINSSNSRLLSQCVYCNQRTFDNTVSACTDKSSLQSNITQSQAFCLLTSCLGQIPQQNAPLIGRKKRSSGDLDYDVSPMSRIPDADEVVKISPANDANARIEVGSSAPGTRSDDSLFYNPLANPLKFVSKVRYTEKVPEKEARLNEKLVGIQWEHWKPRANDKKTAMVFIDEDDKRQNDKVIEIDSSGEVGEDAEFVVEVVEEEDLSLSPSEEEEYPSG